MQPLQHGPDLHADRGAKARVPRFEALGRHYPNRDFLGRQRLTGGKPQRIHAEPRQFVVREILRPLVAALRGGIVVGSRSALQQAQRAVDMRQVGAALVQFFFQLGNMPAISARLAISREIGVVVHAARLRCQ